MSGNRGAAAVLVNRLRVIGDQPHASLRAAPDRLGDGPSLRRAFRLSRSCSPVAKAALPVAAVLVAAVTVTAVVVHVLAASDARGFLGFTFPGVPRRFAEWVTIFMHNARILVGVVVACIVMQVARQSPGAGIERALVGAFTIVCDIVVLTGATVQGLLIGAAIGAYGRRAVAATLPHGLLELTAFSLALAMYLTARRGALRRRTLLITSTAAVAALAIGAVLELLGW